jgi:CIC family chloride channel protein
MTSVFMIFELTQDYQVLVPLMIANMISFLISKRYQPVPLYRALLQQDHVHLPDPATAMPTGAWRARDVMTNQFTSIPSDSSIEVASRFMAESSDRCFPVGRNGTFEGLVSRDSIEQAQRSGRSNESVASLLISDPAHVHPDHPLDLVLNRLAQNPGLLPVLSRTDVHHIEGVITPKTLIQFVQKTGENVHSTN